MLKIHQIKVSLGDALSKEHIAKKLGCPVGDIVTYTIEKQSLDARKESCVFSYSVCAQVRNEKRYLKNKDVVVDTTKHYVNPPSITKPISRPIIVGLGPSGLFAGLILAEAGARPILLERGVDVDSRKKDVQTFFQGGTLNPESNVQYGEGGAGTFSDGKLTTRIQDVRKEKVLSEFIEAGADPSIAYLSHPHLGTDLLSSIVKKMREKILAHGGEIRFSTRFESFVLNQGKIVGVQTSQGEMDCDTVFLCLGHSAQDTYQTLQAQGLSMEQKEFAMGFRVEHPQDMINKAQYKRFAGHPKLEPAEYYLAHTTRNGRGVYSFCMCPGGEVIPSNSVPKTLVVNGMSNHQRSGALANSAILVQVKKKDFDQGNVFDGFLYQSSLEHSFYQASNSYAAPRQNVQDFIDQTVSSSFAFETTYPLGSYGYNLQSFFPTEMNESLVEGLSTFDKKIPGFVGQGILIGLESRSSSPIRVLRGENGQSVSFPGCYPCGEGAGYAGGIVSSSVDGIRQAENYLASLQENA